MKPAEKALPYPPYVLARIAHLRKANHLTQKEVASYLGVSQQTYSAYERGESVMSIEVFIRLGRLYNVNIDFIIGVSNLLQEFPKY